MFKNEKCGYILESTVQMSYWNATMNEQFMSCIQTIENLLMTMTKNFIQYLWELWLKKKSSEVDQVSRMQCNPSLISCKSDSKKRL